MPLQHQPQPMERMFAKIVILDLSTFNLGQIWRLGCLSDTPARGMALQSVQWTYLPTQQWTLAKIHMHWHHETWKLCMHWNRGYTTSDTVPSRRGPGTPVPGQITLLCTDPPTTTTTICIHLGADKLLGPQLAAQQCLISRWPGTLDPSHKWGNGNGGLWWLVSTLFILWYTSSSLEGGRSGNKMQNVGRCSLLWDGAWDRILQSQAPRLPCTTTRGEGILPVSRSLPRKNSHWLWQPIGHEKIERQPPTGPSEVLACRSCLWHLYHLHQPPSQYHNWTHLWPPRQTDPVPRPPSHGTDECGNGHGGQSKSSGTRGIATESHGPSTHCRRRVDGMGWWSEANLRSRPHYMLEYLQEKDKSQTTQLRAPAWSRLQQSWLEVDRASIQEYATPLLPLDVETRMWMFWGRHQDAPVEILGAQYLSLLQPWSGDQITFDDMPRPCSQNILGPECGHCRGMAVYNRHCADNPMMPYQRPPFEGPSPQLCSWLWWTDTGGSRMANKNWLDEPDGRETC